LHALCLYIAFYSYYFCAFIKYFSINPRPIFAQQRSFFYYIFPFYQQNFCLFTLFIIIFNKFVVFRLHRYIMEEKRKGAYGYEKQKKTDFQ